MTLFNAASAFSQDTTTATTTATTNMTRNATTTATTNMTRNATTTATTNMTTNATSTAAPAYGGGLYLGSLLTCYLSIFLCRLLLTV